MYIIIKKKSLKRLRIEELTCCTITGLGEMDWILRVSWLKTWLNDLKEPTLTLLKLDHYLSQMSGWCHVSDQHFYSIGVYFTYCTGHLFYHFHHLLKILVITRVYHKGVSHCVSALCIALCIAMDSTANVSKQVSVVSISAFLNSSSLIYIYHWLLSAHAAHLLLMFGSIFMSLSVLGRGTEYLTHITVQLRSWGSHWSVFSTFP